MTDELDDKTRAELVAALKSRYSELWHDVQRELGDRRPYLELAGETHDPGDESSADVLVDLNLADVHRDIQEMRDVHAALEHVVGGDYGVCVDCGVQIPLARLRANPAALRCVQCQNLYEHTHGRTHPTL